MRLELADGGQQRMSWRAPLHQGAQVTSSTARAAPSTSRSPTPPTRSRQAAGLGFAGSGGRVFDGKPGRASRARSKSGSRRRRGSGHSRLIANGGRGRCSSAGRVRAMESVLEMDQLSFGQAALNTRVMGS